CRGVVIGPPQRVLRESIQANLVQLEIGWKKYPEIRVLRESVCCRLVLIDIPGERVVGAHPVDFISRRRLYRRIERIEPGKQAGRQRPTRVGRVDISCADEMDAPIEVVRRTEPPTFFDVLFECKRGIERVRNGEVWIACANRTGIYARGDTAAFI